MRRLKRLPSPGVLIGTVAMVFALGGGAYAAELIQSSDIAPEAVKGSKIAPGAVKNSKIKDNGIRGNKIDETSLSKVPHAQAAVNAEHIGGLPADQVLSTRSVRPFTVKLDFGEDGGIASTGPVSLYAECRENVSGSQDQIRMLAYSSADGSFMQGDTPHSGPGVGSNYLTPTTPPDNRSMGGLISTPAGDGQPAADDDIDTGFVAGPNGEYLGIDETTMFALHVGDSDCLMKGMVTVIP